MPEFMHRGARLFYETAGTGQPIVLVHGFASTHKANWVDTGWQAALVAQGYLVFLPDGRGHGRSGGSHDESDYGLAALASDVVAMMDDAGLERAVVMGYSMGAMVALAVAAEFPERVSAVIAAGVGGHLLRPLGDPEVVPAALAASSLADVGNPVGRQFRAFADANGQDRQALIACYRSLPRPYPRDILARIACPVLVVAGETDMVAGSPTELAEAIPGASAVTVPRRDHMRTVGDKAYQAAVFAFLAELPAG